MGSGGGRRAVPAPFLTKTHHMVEDKETDDVLSWGKDGSSFIVWKPAEFANELLPVHFKHNRFSSFVRQLNTYGFRKVVSDRWEFANDKFRRGEEALLCEIQRRCRPRDSSALEAALPPLAPQPRPTTNSGTTDSPDTLSSSSNSPQLPPVPKLTDLTKENTNLRLEKETLTMEIERTKRMCKDLLASLSKYVDTKGMNLQLLLKEGDFDSLEHMLHMKNTSQVAIEEPKVEHVKLFGALLKVSVQSSMKDRKRTVGWCEITGDMCSVDERPLKIAPWIPGTSSFTPEVARSLIN